MIAAATLAAATGCAAWSDIRDRRVSNRLNLAILVLGLAWRATTLDAGTVVLGVGGAAVGIALLFVPFALGWVGAADAKLLAAIGAWLGPFDTALAGTLGLVGGGVLAVALSIAAGRGVVRDVFRNVYIGLMTMLVARSTPAVPARGRELTVPLAVPLAVAALAVFVARGH
jgi:prepilin peptidase CpaA